MDCLSHEHTQPRCKKWYKDLRLKTRGSSQKYPSHGANLCCSDKSLELQEHPVTL